MTPNQVARKTNLIRAHEKALKLPVNAAFTNGFLQLEIEELEHGFLVDEFETLRFLPDPVTKYLFDDLIRYDEFYHIDDWANSQLAPAQYQSSLRKFYRNAGYAVKSYLEKFPRSNERND